MGKLVKISLSRQDDCLFKYLKVPSLEKSEHIDSIVEKTKKNVIVQKAEQKSKVSDNWL